MNYAKVRTYTNYYTLYCFVIFIIGKKNSPQHGQLIGFTNYLIIYIHCLLILIIILMVFRTWFEVWRL